MPVLVAEPYNLSQNQISPMPEVGRTMESSQLPGSSGSSGENRAGTTGVTGVDGVDGPTPARARDHGLPGGARLASLVEA